MPIACMSSTEPNHHQTDCHRNIHSIPSIYLTPRQIFLLVFFPFCIPFFTDSTFELAVDTGFLFEINFLQAFVTFIFTLIASLFSSAVFTAVSARIALFLLFLPRFCVFLGCALGNGHIFSGENDSGILISTQIDGVYASTLDEVSDVDEMGWHSF